MKKYIENKTLKLKKAEAENFIKGIKEMKELMADIGLSKIIVKIEQKEILSLENRY